MFDRLKIEPNTPRLSVHQPDVDSVADSSLNLALTVAEGADERKADDIALLNVEDVSYLADYFVVMTGFSKVQVRAIARAIEDKVEERFGRSPIQVEGISDGTWVLLDYGEVIAHIFTPEEREFYSLEAFWGHAERIDFAAMADRLPSASQ